MAIAKVEPLTTARALRGPFDYRLPERLGEVGVGSVLLVPFGRRRVLGVVVELAESSELPPERLAEPIEALEAGAPPELVRLGLWVGARVLLDPRPRAASWCCRPATGRRRAAGPGRGSSCAAADRGRPARRLATASRLGLAPARGARRLAGAAAGGEISAAELAAHGGADRAGPAAPRGARPGRRCAARAASPAPGDRRGRRPGDATAADAPSSERRSTRSSPRSTAAGAPRAPPARRHRLGQDRGLPRGGRGGARAGPGRDRPRPRDRAHAADGGPLPRRGFGDRVAVLHSGARRGRALRRVAAPALRRGAGLRRPALGGLRAGRATSA